MQNKKEPTVTSAQDFLNVLDIRSDVLYTMDGYMIAYMLIHPFNKDLLSDRELIKMTATLTGELSQEKKPWKFLAVSKPVDVAPILSENQQLLTNSSDAVQKKLLRNENTFMSELATSGDISERQYYMMCWEKQEDASAADVRKRMQDMANRFESVGIWAELLKKPDIIKLLNLIHNPEYVLLEDTETTALFPIMQGGYEQGGDTDEEA